MESLVTIILVVDDHALARATTAETLKAAGCSAVAVGSLADARETFEGHHADIALIIADAKLSRPHGFRFLHEVRAINPRVPIMLTTTADDPDWYEDLDLVAIVRTPVQGDDLTAAVRRALAQPPPLATARVSGGNGVWRGTPSASGTFATPALHPPTPIVTPSTGGLQSASKEPSPTASALAAGAGAEPPSPTQNFEAASSGVPAAASPELVSTRDMAGASVSPRAATSVPENEDAAGRGSALEPTFAPLRTMTAGASHGAMSTGLRGAQRAAPGTVEASGLPRLTGSTPVRPAMVARMAAAGAAASTASTASTAADTATRSAAFGPMPGNGYGWTWGEGSAPGQNPVPWQNLMPGQDAMPRQNPMPGQGAMPRQNAVSSQSPMPGQQSPMAGLTSSPERGWALARRNGTGRFRGAPAFQWPPRAEDLARIEVVDAATWVPVTVEPDPMPPELLEPLKVGGESLPDVNVTDLRALLERSRSVADHAHAFAHEARALAAATQAQFFADDAPTVAERSRTALEQTRSAASRARAFAAEARTRLAQSQFATEAPQFIAEGSRAIVDGTRAVAESADAVVSQALVRLAESRLAVATPPALAALSNVVATQSRAVAKRSRVAVDRSKAAMVQAGAAIAERAARQKSALSPAAAAAIVHTTRPVRNLDAIAAIDREQQNPGDAAAAAAGIVERAAARKPTTADPIATASAPIATASAAPVVDRVERIQTGRDRGRAAQAPVNPSKPAAAPAISRKRSNRSKRAGTRAAPADARVDRPQHAAPPRSANTWRAPQRIVAATVVSLSCLAFATFFEMRSPTRVASASSVSSAASRANATSSAGVAGAPSASSAADVATAGANQPSLLQSGSSGASGATSPNYAIGSAASPDSLGSMASPGSLPSNESRASTASPSAPASTTSTTSPDSSASAAATGVRGLGRAGVRQPTRPGKRAVSDESDDRSREVGDDEVVPARGENFRREPRAGVSSHAVTPESEPDPSVPSAVFSRRQYAYPSPAERTVTTPAPPTSTRPPSPKASSTTGAGSGPGSSGSGSGDGYGSGSASNGSADRATTERKASGRHEPPSDPLGGADLNGSGLHVEEFRGADPRSLASRVNEPRGIASHTSHASEIRPAESRTTTSAPRGESHAGAPRSIATVPSPLSSTLSRSLVPASPLSSGAPAPSSSPAHATAAAATAVNMNHGEEQRIHAALKQYKSAYDRLDANAARAVWPTLDTRALARAFGGLKMQEVEFAKCDLAIESIEATAVCGGSATYVPRVGSQQRHTESREWTFRFKKVDRDWMIVKAETRTDAHGR